MPFIGIISYSPSLLRNVSETGIEFCQILFLNQLNYHIFFLFYSVNMETYVELLSITNPTLDF